MTGGDRGPQTKHPWLFIQHLLAPAGWCWIAGASFEPPRTPPHPTKTNSRNPKKRPKTKNQQPPASKEKKRLRPSTLHHRPPEAPESPSLALCRPVVLLDPLGPLLATRWPLLATAGPLLDHCSLRAGLCWTIASPPLLLLTLCHLWQGEACGGGAHNRNSDPAQLSLSPPALSPSNPCYRLRSGCPHALS